ncbi:MAG: septal ring lytic transglycosylase RlpA family protein, partial [Bacteroidota bacterium]
MKNLKVFLFTTLFIIACQQGFSQITKIGLASFYNDKFEGRKTASGEVYDKTKMTAAHRTLPFNTRIKVTNLVNKQSIIVTINDRGPFIKGRIIDLSKAAAIKLGFVNKGVTKVM